MPSPPWSVWVQRPEAKLICLKFCKGRSSPLHLETVEFSLQALKRSALSPITPDLTHHVYQFSKLAVTLDLNLVAQNYRNLCLTAAEARRPKSRWCRAGHAPSRDARGKVIPCLFQLLVATGIFLLQSASLPSPPPSFHCCPESPARLSALGTSSQQRPFTQFKETQATFY